MTQDLDELETYLSALQQDLPSGEQERRMKKALLSAAGGGAILLSAESARAAAQLGEVTAGAALPLASGAPAGVGFFGGALGAKSLLALGALVTATGVGWLWSDQVSEAGQLAKPGQVEQSSADVQEPASPSGHERSTFATSSGDQVAGQEEREVAARMAREASGGVSASARANPHRGALGDSQRTSAQGMVDESLANGKLTVSTGVPDRMQEAARSKKMAPSPKSAAALKSSSQLAEEAALLKSALLAIQEKDWGAAEHHLELHRQRFPGGELVSERKRTAGRLRQARSSTISR